MALILKQYKYKTGDINYPAVFNIPSVERLPALIEKDFIKATALVVAAITLAFEKINIKNKKGEAGKLINDIADEIIDSVGEDNMSLEDLVLFLQGMVRGKYGDVTEITVTKFMKLLETYRQERHLALIVFRENQHLEYKALGDADRVTKGDPLADHLASFGERISELKQSLQYEKNRNLRDVDKF